MPKTNQLAHTVIIAKIVLTLAQQLCAAIKVLQSDCGKEYLSGAFDKHLAVVGTVQQLTLHDTPQLNSMAKWLNNTIVECIQAFTHSSSLPKFLWGEALSTWLKNCTAIHALDGLMPFQALFGCVPDILRLHRWGAPIWGTCWWQQQIGCTCMWGMLSWFWHWVVCPLCYFRSSCSVAIEHNVYFSAAPQLKGEQLAIPGTECKQHVPHPQPPQ